MNDYEVISAGQYDIITENKSSETNHMRISTPEVEVECPAPSQKVVDSLALGAGTLFLTGNPVLAASAVLANMVFGD